MGFKSHELSKLKLLVIENKEIFWEKWHEYFGNGLGVHWPEVDGDVFYSAAQICPVSVI